MLKKKAEDRISTIDAINHPWFTKFPEQIASVDKASNTMRKELYDDNNVRWIDA